MNAQIQPKKPGETRAERKERQAANRAVLAAMSRQERRAQFDADLGVTLPTLQVKVRGGGVLTLFGRRRLGSLAGASAEVTDGARVARVGAAVGATVVLGPAGMLAALSQKSRAHAFVVFADGTYHERKLDGNAAVRTAQAECVRFNLLAHAASGQADEEETAAQEPAAAASAAERLAEATRLHDAGLLTDEEYQAKRAEIIGEL